MIGGGHTYHMSDVKHEKERKEAGQEENNCAENTLVHVYQYCYITLLPHSLLFSLCYILSSSSTVYIQLYCIYHNETAPSGVCLK
jgi:hypothetical protein